MAIRPWCVMENRTCCIKTDEGALTAADLIRCRENICKGVGRHKTEAATAEEMGTARGESWVDATVCALPM